jgi:SNF2 family DNA or RNA helicase
LPPFCWTWGWVEGKTAITLTAMLSLLHDSFELRRVLVVAPLRVCEVWREEIARWDHLHELTCAVATGTPQARLAALASGAEITCINRENVQWLVEASNVRPDFDCLVVDESSSFKNHRTKRFRAAMKLRPRCRRVLLLSGTPISNNLLDLWAQFRLLDMGERLGRYIGAFREQYFIADKRNGAIVYTYLPRTGAEESIYRRIEDITISMRAIDHLKMPDCVYSEYPVRLSPDERRQYDTLRRTKVLTRGETEVTAANAATLSGKLVQLANGALYDDDGRVLTVHDRKLDALEDMLEASHGHPVLVAYWYRHDLDRIERRLRALHIPFERLDTLGSIRRWNLGETPVALIHPASAGHGINLQHGGATLIWFGLTWSLELYQQTNARLWRQGQTQTVVIHHIICENTIDASILAALHRKSRSQAALIDAVKANLEGV